MDREPQRFGAMIRILIILIFIWLLFNIFVRPTCAGAELSFTWNDTRENYHAKIDTFLVDYFSKCNPRKLRNARALIPIVLDVSERENVNPSLIASIISFESTWDHAAIGALGEIGLMQVNNKSLGNDPAEQLTVGVSMLKDSYSKCGTIIGAVSYYGTGHTCKPYRGAELRIKRAERIESL